MAVYLIMGLLGLPVFAGGQSGFGAIAGPTGGYLLGFVAGSMVTGWLFRSLQHRNEEGKPSARWDYVAALLSIFCGGILCVHALGVAYLSINLHMSLRQAFVIGTLPFLPGDILKALIAAAIGPRLADLKI